MHSPPEGTGPIGSDHERETAAVAALVNEYARRLDAGDLDGVAALFARGVFRSSRGTNLSGADAVRHVYDPVILYGDATPRTKHVLGNLDVTVDSAAGTATARCTFTVLQAVPGFALQPVLAGRYHDVFARADGEWHYVERIVHPDLAGDLTHHMATGGLA